MRWLPLQSPSFNFFLLGSSGSKDEDSLLLCEVFVFALFIGFTPTSAAGAAPGPVVCVSADPTIAWALLLALDAAYESAAVREIPATDIEASPPPAAAAPPFDTVEVAFLDGMV